MEDEPTTVDSASSDSIDDVEVQMDGEETTENKPTDDTAGDQPAASDKLPSDEDAAPAAEETPAFDTDLDEWAEKAGHDKPETDRERKLLQNLRNSSREFTRDRQSQAQTDLNKAIRDATPKVDDEAIVDPLEKDVRNLQVQLRQAESRRLMSEYLSTHTVTNEEQTAMAEVLKEKADRGDMTAFNYLSDGENIADWHALGKTRLAQTTDSSAAVAEKARQEERERLAKESKASGPNRNAHSNTPAPKKDELAELFSDL